MSAVLNVNNSIVKKNFFQTLELVRMGKSTHPNGFTSFLGTSRPVGEVSSCFLLE